MKNKHAIVALIVLFAAFSLTGCLDLLTMNAFGDMDAPPPVDEAQLVEMTDEEVIEEITTQSESQDFYDDLATNPEKKQTVVDQLAEVYDPANEESTPEEKQQAALLVADVELKTTGGAQVAEDTIMVVGTLAESFASDDPDAPEPDVDQIISDTITTAFGSMTDETGAFDDAKFDETIAAFQAAADAYEAFANSLTDTDGDGSVDAPEDTNIASVAQDAVIALAIDVATSTPENTETLRAIASGDETADTEALMTSIVESLDPNTTDSTAIQNLLEASDLMSMFEGMM